VGRFIGAVEFRWSTDIDSQLLAFIGAVFFGSCFRYCVIGFVPDGIIARDVTRRLLDAGDFRLELAIGCCLAGRVVVVGVLDDRSLCLLYGCRGRRVLGWGGFARRLFCGWLPVPGEFDRQRMRPRRCVGSRAG